MNLSQHSRIIRIGAQAYRVNWLVLLCLCSSLGMFISLGFWQLDRAEQKRNLASDLQQRETMRPVPLAQAAQHAQFGHLFRVLLEGHFENDAPFLIPFQFYRGQGGFELIMPFRLADGSLVLLSRGWLAPGDDGGLPPIPEVEGEYQLQAQVVVPDVEPERVAVIDRSWPVRLSRLNVAQAGRLLGESVYPWLLRLEADQPGVLARHWAPPRVTIRTHIGYAIQWFLIALAVLGAAILLARVKSE